MIEEHFFNDRTSLFKALAEECKSILSAAVEQRDQATFLVSGGSTPKPLYQALANEALPWSNITVALVDERWVDRGEQGSNADFITDNLLQHQASASRFIEMKNNETTAAEGMAYCEQAYKEQLTAPFDVVILGMGPDGHTASLFPHAEGLDEALSLINERLCAPILAHQSDVTGELTERMSLSLFGLMQSRQIHLLITGDEKRQIYQQAKECKDVCDMPVAAVLQQQKIAVHVYWAP